jgi:hypothetical protein
MICNTGIQASADQSSLFNGPSLSMKTDPISETVCALE